MMGVKFFCSSPQAILPRALLQSIKAKIMASVLTFLTADIVWLLAALSIWTASFLLLLRSRIPSVD